MSQSLSKLYVHIIFHTKNSFATIHSQDKKDLFAYMGSIIVERLTCPFRAQTGINQIDQIAQGVAVGLK